MKNLNYLSQNRGSLAALQSSAVGYDCRSTVVRPSFDRRSTLLKLITVLVLVLTLGVGNAWGAPQSVSYTFTNKSFATSANAWKCNTEGNGFSNSGVQCTTGKKGKATTKSSISNVSKIIVTYCTNGSSGAGNITIKIGSNSAVDKAVTKTGGTTGRTLIWEYDTPQSGTVSIQGNTTTNSIYIIGIQIFYGYTVKYNANGGTGTMTDDNSPYASGATVTVKSNSFTAPEGKLFNGWKTAPSSGTSYAAGATFSISAHTTLYAQWTTPATSVTASPDHITFDDNTVEVGTDEETTTITLTNGYPYGGNYLYGWFEDVSDEDHCEFFVNSASTYSYTTSGSATPTLTLSYLADAAGTFTGNFIIQGYNSSYAAVNCTIPLSVTLTSSCANKVALTKGVPTNGSFSLSSENGSYDNCDNDFEVTVLDITPNSGYGCIGVTESDGTYSIVVGPDGSGNYTVTYERGHSITSTVTANFAQKVATPTFSVEGGTYNATQSVTLSCATENATIYYTTNGSTPTTSSTEYNNTPISVTTTNTTIKAIAVKSNMANSDVASATYTLKCATPAFSPVAGTYTGAQSVAISCTTADADIFYSTDGNDPYDDYSTAINVATSMTLKAQASKTGWTDSDIATAAYTIQYTVSWSVNGSPYSSPVNVNAGSTTSTPANPSVPPTCTGSTFMGWTATENYSGNSAPGNLFNGTTPAITGNITFYAVFADEVNN